MNKHICLDLHGIIDANPVFFSALTQSLIKDGWEITVATGSHLVEGKIHEELNKYGIAYTHLFSISDYHRDNKTGGMWYDTDGNPWVSDEDWDKTKAEYCKKHNISFCIDDTARYANYFDTPFGYMSIQMSKDKPNKYLGLIISMFEARRRKTTNPQEPKLGFWEKVNKKLIWFTHPSTKLGKER